MKCSICKENTAVIFVTKIVDNKQEKMGICLPCAKEQGIAPMEHLLEQSGMSPEDFENISEQMMNIIGDVDIDEMVESLSIGEGENIQGGLSEFFNSAFSGIKNKGHDDMGNEEDEEIITTKTKTKTIKTTKKRKRKNLDTYGHNLTEKAKNNEVDRIIGRSREIDCLIHILNIRPKNNPVLIVDPGVGKTEIAEWLAVRIVEKQVPAKVLDTEIYLLDLTAVVAGTQFRGQFEARMKAIINEANEEGNIILVIDELHNIVGAGEAEGGAMNAANILKPALARGEVQVIGATTLEEYRKHIEKDAALERRFQPVIVDEPNIEDTIEIIKGIKDYYEEYHKVKISDDIIELAVKMSERYIHDRFLPDKAIDVIDEAGSRANLKNKGLVELEALRIELKKVVEEKEIAAANDDYKLAADCKANELRITDKIESIEKQCENVKINSEDIAYVIEAWTKIPVASVKEEEAYKLLNLEERLHYRIIGQNDAVTKLSKAIRRNRSGFKKRNKPSSFIFVGPTGVGKTEITKALAYELFGSDASMIRLDMSEFMEKHTVSKLIGAPPGYVGYDQGGQLTEKIRRRPYSVILLDEIEKAHPDVFNMLLQILEDGRLTDSQGRTVNFENTIIIMTSNAGTNNSGNGIGFNKQNKDSMDAKVKDALKQIFRPEFLNRIDEIVVFEELTREELLQIIDIMLQEIKNAGKEKKIEIIVEKEVKDYILEKGYDTKYGARPLRRAIQKYIEDEIAEKYIKNELKDNSTIRFVFEKERIETYIQ